LIATTEDSGFEEDQEYVPVSYVMPVRLGGQPDHFNIVKFKSANLRFDDQTSIKFSKDTIKILRGKILLDTNGKKVSHLKAFDTDILVAPNSIVSLTTNDSGLTIRCLHESGEPVLVKGKTQIRIRSGEQLHLGTKSGFDESEKVAIRKSVGLSWSSFANATLAEYALMSFANEDRLFRLVRRSSSNDDKKLMAKVLKTHAALSTVTSNHGIFKIRP
jgi:hypothetical protein